MKVTTINLQPFYAFQNPSINSLLILQKDF